MWRKDPLRLVILWWTALVAGILVWLPLVRGATQGDPYKWVLAPGIGGRGIGGHYWVLVPGVAFVVSLLYLGWRGARQPFHWLLLAFHVPLAVAVTYAAWTSPQGLRFEGTTAGVDVPLAVIGPVLFCGVAGAAIIWVLRDLRTGRQRESPPWQWTRAARVRLALLIVIVPIEVVLFRSGGIQSVQNMIGVAFVGWQWVLINRLLAGARSPSTAP